jgi:hypothetical protein
MYNINKHLQSTKMKEQESFVEMFLTFVAMLGCVAVLYLLLLGVFLR